MALVSGLSKIYKTGKPFEWMREFPPAAEIPQEYQQALSSPERRGGHVI